MRMTNEHEKRERRAGEWWTGWEGGRAFPCSLEPARPPCVCVLFFFVRDERGEREVRMDGEKRFFRAARVKGGAGRAEGRSFQGGPAPGPACVCVRV